MSPPSPFHPAIWLDGWHCSHLKAFCETQSHSFAWFDFWPPGQNVCVWHFVSLKQTSTELFPQISVKLLFDTFPIILSWWILGYKSFYAQYLTGCLKRSMLHQIHFNSVQYAINVVAILEQFYMFRHLKKYLHHFQRPVLDLMNTKLYVVSHFC